MISVDFKMPKKTPRPGAVRRMRVAGGVGVGLAEAIRERQFDRGRPVDQAPPYDSTGVKLVSPRYPVIAQGRQSSSGAMVYATSAAFHANIRRGSYNVSAGLRSGMTVLVRNNRAVIRFRGRSEGQEPNFRTRADGSKVARGKKVSNALKAATVLKAHGVNVVQNSPGEWRSVAQAVEELSRRAVEAAMPFKAVWTKGRQSPLARRMVILAERNARGL